MNGGSIGLNPATCRRMYGPGRTVYETCAVQYQVQNAVTLCCLRPSRLTRRPSGTQHTSIPAYSVYNKYSTGSVLYSCGYGHACSTLINGLKRSLMRHIEGVWSNGTVGFEDGRTNATDSPTYEEEVHWHHARDTRLLLRRNALAMQWFNPTWAVSIVRAYCCSSSNRTTSSTVASLGISPSFSPMPTRLLNTTSATSSSNLYIMA